MYKSDVIFQITIIKFQYSVFVTLQVVDGRPKGRFEGTAPEPNPSINSGHMLGTTNMPFTQR